MEYMKLFKESGFDDEELQLLDKSKTTLSDFEKVKQQLIQSKYKAAADYLQDADSLEEIVLIAKAFSLGEEYAKAMKGDYSVEEKKILLFGFLNGLNVTEQLEGGEYLENLALLIEASNKPEFRLMDFFDKTGSYINYPKLQQFLNNL